MLQEVRLQWISFMQLAKQPATEFTEETDLPATHYWKVWFLPRELQKKDS